jgi:hypothetical protein
MSYTNGTVPVAYPVGPIIAYMRSKLLSAFAMLRNNDMVKAGTIIGSVMNRNRWNADAPSIFAASITSVGMFWSPARYTIM